MRGGQPILRGKQGTPPCRTRRGCPKGTPESPKSLSPRNVAAYLHYLECAAAMQFPDDAIVRRNAMICRQAEVACQRHHDTDMTLAIVRAVSHA